MNFFEDGVQRANKMASAFRQLFLTTLLSQYSQIASPILKLQSRTDVFACDVQDKEPCVLFFFSFSCAILSESCALFTSCD